MMLMIMLGVKMGTLQDKALLFCYQHWRGPHDNRFPRLTIAHEQIYEYHESALRISPQIARSSVSCTSSVHC